MCCWDRSDQQKSAANVNFPYSARTGEIMHYTVPLEINGLSL